MVAMRREDGSYTVPQPKKPAANVPSQPNWMWPVVATVLGLAAIGVGGFLYFTKLETLVASKDSPSVASNAAANNAALAASVPTAPPPPSLPPIPSGEKFATETVPFISDRIRATLAKEYAPASDYKALAININGNNGFIAGQPNEDAAKSAALEQCQKRADFVQSPRKCELYAVGNVVVYAHGKPPMPPMPWMRRDPMTERPFASKEMPMLRDPAKTRIESSYVPGQKPKSIAISPNGQYFLNFREDSIEESMRRALQSCGAIANANCIIVAVDDAFVVPVPTTRKVIGFFRAAGNSSIAADMRDDVERKLTDASNGWNAIAVGTAGRPGMALNAADEQNAVNGALAECVKRDSECHVIAIGPFMVEPN
jgi:adenylate cyclase